MGVNLPVECMWSLAGQLGTVDGEADVLMSCSSVQARSASVSFTAIILNVAVHPMQSTSVLSRILVP